jgi:hypothetical protein
MFYLLGLGDYLSISILPNWKLFAIDRFSNFKFLDEKINTVTLLFPDFSDISEKWCQIVKYLKCNWFFSSWVSRDN